MTSDLETTDKDLSIMTARESRVQVVERLSEVALAEPPTHVSVAASKLLLEIADEKTTEERDPFGVLTW